MKKNLLYKIEGRIIPFFVNVLSDTNYLRWVFKHNMGYKLDLKNPRSFSEKLQWLKLYDQHHEYTSLVDKVEAKKYVASIIGEKYIIPTLGVWNSIDEIDWNTLPNQFVIKSTNDSGGVVICKDKSKLNIEQAKEKLRGLGKRNYSKYNKEYPYSKVPHRFIAEQYMEDESRYELKDYKIFCFDGKPKFLYVATGRQMRDTRFDFYDINFNHLPVTNGHPNADSRPEKPANFEEMVLIAAQLSKGFPHIRVDLYNCNGKIYFGELTFFHFSGTVPFEPREWDYKFGELLNLPQNKR